MTNHNKLLFGALMSPVLKYDSNIYTNYIISPCIKTMQQELFNEKKLIIKRIF